MARKPPPTSPVWQTVVTFPDPRLLVAIDDYAKRAGVMRNEAILRLLDRALREAGHIPSGTSGGPGIIEPPGGI